MAWIYIIAAGVLEVVWSYAMKEADGFTRLWPSVVTVLALAVSFVFLAAALKSLPLGTAYTMFTGMGAVGAFVVGIIVLNEQASLVRILAAALIVSGVVLMKVTSTE